MSADVGAAAGVRAEAKKPGRQFQAVAENARQDRAVTRAGLSGTADSRAFVTHIAPARGSACGHREPVASGTMADDLIDPRRADPPLVAAERAMLDGWLDFQRGTLLLKCDGLDDEQRKQRPVATSLMSLHGLVRHMADVERHWFQRVLDRDPKTPAPFWSPAVVDADWAPLGDADWGADFAVWQMECERSREAAAAHELDDIGVGVSGGERVEVSLRWIFNHMIEEYARHNGHADLIREMVDGSVGC